MVRHLLFELVKLVGNNSPLMVNISQQAQKSASLIVIIAYCT